MVKVQDGQCGLCAHFGEAEPTGRAPAILEILATRQASELFLAACMQEHHRGSHLRVTPVSGCDSWMRAT